jgi:hypothetical protein
MQGKYLTATWAGFDFFFNFLMHSLGGFSSGLSLFTEARHIVEYIKQ